MKHWFCHYRDLHCVPHISMTHSPWGCPAWMVCQRKTSGSLYRWAADCTVPHSGKKRGYHLPSVWTCQAPLGFTWNGLLFVLQLRHKRLHFTWDTGALVVHNHPSWALPYYLGEEKFGGAIVAGSWPLCPSQRPKSEGRWILVWPCLRDWLPRWYWW